MDHTPTSEQAQTLLAQQEEVFYGDGEVWITDQRLVYGGHTHYLKGLKEARVKGYKASDRIRDALVGIPVILVVLTISLVNWNDLRGNEYVRVAISFLFGLSLLATIGVIVCLPYVKRMLAGQPDVYAVTLRDRFGRTPILYSTDRDYIRGVADMLQYAIDRKNNLNTHYPSINNKGVPVPTIHGRNVYVGSKIYTLEDVVLVKAAAILPRSPLSLFLPLFLAVHQVTMIADRHTKGFEWLFVIITLFCMFGLAASMWTGAQGNQQLYTVQLNTPASKQIIYATTDKDRAKSVKRQIEFEIARSAGAHNGA